MTTVRTMHTTRPSGPVRLTRGWTSCTVALILGLLLATSAIASCSDLTASETPPTAVPEASRGPGIEYSCPVADQFHAQFTSTEIFYDDNVWPVDVNLGEPNCPPGAVVLRCDYCVDNGGVFYTPTGDVQFTFTIRAPTTAEASRYRLVVTFNAEKISRIVLEGNGDPVEVQRQ